MERDQTVPLWIPGIVVGIWPGILHALTPWFPLIYRLPFKRRGQRLRKPNLSNRTNILNWLLRGTSFLPRSPSKRLGPGVLRLCPPAPRSGAVLQTKLATFVPLHSLGN